MRQFLDQWLLWNVNLLQGPTWRSLAYYARTAVWFFWPLWPFVLWAIWRWRGSRREAPVAVPAVMLVPLALLALLDPVGSEASMLPLVLPMTMLAALALPTIRRSVVSLIDWFSVMTFSVVGLYDLGLLDRLHDRLPAADGAQSAGGGSRLRGAAVDRSNWVWVCSPLSPGYCSCCWRISRQPRPFWRPMALSSGGMVLTWLLLMTLWLPAANFRKSYREVVSPTREILAGETGCVTGVGIDVAQRALLAYYGNARFIRLPRMDGEDPMPSPSSCPWMLVSDREDRPHDLSAIAGGGAADPDVGSGEDADVGREVGQRPSGWTLIWHGQRRVSRGERLFLYARDGLAMK